MSIIDGMSSGVRGSWSQEDLGEKCSRQKNSKLKTQIWGKSFWYILRINGRPLWLRSKVIEGQNDRRESWRGRQIMQDYLGLGKEFVFYAKYNESH